MDEEEGTERTGSWYTRLVINGSRFNPRYTFTQYNPPYPSPSLHTNPPFHYTASCLPRVAFMIDWRRTRAGQTIHETLRTGKGKDEHRIELVESPSLTTFNSSLETMADSNSINSSPVESMISEKRKNSRNGTGKHVTFSEPEVSHVLITREESILNDTNLKSAVATVENPLTIRRCYLAERDIFDKLRNLNRCQCWNTNDTWSELYYDTPGSILSSLECILMKDTKSPKYWKFFSFAEDNIMEITTDEKEISEPLSRLRTSNTENGENGNTDRIDSESLQTFFSIAYQTDTFMMLDDGTRVKVTVTDYGFAWVVVERLCVNGDRLAQLTEEIEMTADKLGLSSLAGYDPMRYL